MAGIWALEYNDALVKKDRTCRQVWLHNTDMFYRILNMEYVLVEELPGYKPRTSFDDSDAGSFHPENPAHVAFPRKSKPVEDDDQASSENLSQEAGNEKLVSQV